MPVSLTSVPGKIMGQVVSKISRHMEKRIWNRQNRFTKSKSLPNSLPSKIKWLSFWKRGEQGMIFISALARFSIWYPTGNILDPYSSLEDERQQDKVKEEVFRLERPLQIKRNFFSVITVKHYSRLPRQVMHCPSLEFFKIWIKEEKALSNLIWQYCRPSWVECRNRYLLMSIPTYTMLWYYIAMNWNDFGGTKFCWKTLFS